MNSEMVSNALNLGMMIAQEYKHEFLTPEHLLKALCSQTPFREFAKETQLPIPRLESMLNDYIRTLDKVPENIEYKLEPSFQFAVLMKLAEKISKMAQTPEIDVPHVFAAMYELQDSMASAILNALIPVEEYSNYVSQLIESYECYQTRMDFEDEDEFKDKSSWHSLVTCLNDLAEKHNPLIGREAEMERTIQVLCRKDKNNPLHIGEPGVGKTALIYGLASLINADKVPERLRDHTIYMLDLGTLVAGAQFRGDFEKRLKNVMEGAQEEENVIIYIDEIHNLVGAGRSEGSLDAGNMLKPYLESGKLRFIGSTTYEEYNRYFSKSKGLVRRFQQIDIQEPSLEETVQILKGLKNEYERYHGIRISDALLEYIADVSARFMADRFLPDKAIDLMDEAATSCELNQQKEVTKEMVGDILSKVCKVDAKALRDDDHDELGTLLPRILSQIYGQDEAVCQVVEAVEMSKAGLLEENKPMASLLFVGPTGVGKTEVARVLAKELGISLVRFDMSEYTEKHTVAKLIGSPAGYVGYEDGGLLTDAIRKTPNCVLLLDEIEKAHPDVFNILLQVMDYACLTDNKGRKADFRHVILLMTSNAGAQYAHQASVGFASHVSTGQAMLAQVKKTFKPEFINRLSSTVVFHDMDYTMASQILDKKLMLLQEKLDKKHVKLILDEDARKFLLDNGFTREYGAREMDRVIQKHLKSVLMKEMLYGSLQKGGDAKVQLKDGELSL